MSGSAPFWSTALQCLLAGAVVGLSALHAGWWRAEGEGPHGPLARRQAAWTLVWSLALAVACLVNGLQPVLRGTPFGALLTAVQPAAVVLAVAVGVPALASLAGPRPVRTVAARGVETLVVAATVVSGALGALGLLLPASAWSDLLHGLWVAPVGLALQVLAAQRIAAERRELTVRLRAAAGDPFGDATERTWPGRVEHLDVETQPDAAAVTRADLVRALVRGDFVAHFQPLTDAATLEVVGLEVLARWQDGDRLRPPSEWLPVAEESSVVVELGRQMLAAARRGSERFDLPVAVNVSARQLDQPDFVRHVEESWGTDAWDRLTLEVTESALLYDAQHVREALETLAARGVRIALDDFGTGYNSLSRLGELPLHVLKIDQAFVRDVGSAQGAAVLRAILALAEVHGLEVVAEGVERLTQLTALVSMGVPVVQGYMLGRPGADVPRRPRVSAAAPRPRGGPPLAVGAAAPV